MQVHGEMNEGDLLTLVERSAAQERMELIPRGLVIDIDIVAGDDASVFELRDAIPTVRAETSSDSASSLADVCLASCWSA